MIERRTAPLQRDILMTSDSCDQNKRPSCLLIARSVDLVGEGNFPKGCEFSPDGLCLLTSTAADHRLRLYNTPSVDEQTDRPFTWKTALSAVGGDSVRSYAWYPHMNSNDAGTCCFLGTSRDQPIHLYDAYTGRVRATYRPFNALDEMESPTVVTFSPNGQHVYAAGFRTDRVIHVFDTTIPGRDSTLLRLGKTRRSTDGQKGLVSAMCFSPRTFNPIFCIGTFSPGSIHVYDERLPSGEPAGTILQGVTVVGHGKGYSKRKQRFVDNNNNNNNNNDNESMEGDFFSREKVRWYQTRARGGVTQLTFQNDYILYSASRRSDAVLAWDLRMLSGNDEYASCPIRGISSYATCSDTNQRLEFDFDPHGQRLFVGGLDQCVRIYDVTSGKLLETLDGLEDVANGISYTSSGAFHSGLLAVAVGARRFPEDSDDDEHKDGGRLLETNVPGSIKLYKV